VTDRRIFADEKGTARVEENPAPPAKPAAAEGAPAVDFHTFVLSLGSSALLHLGELERPARAPPRRTCPWRSTRSTSSPCCRTDARNLTPEEAKLLESLLFDLRLRYVEARNRLAPAGPSEESSSCA